MNELIRDEPTMSSKEIAELTDVRHDSVKRTMQDLTNTSLITFTQIVGKGTGGRPTTIYCVNERDSYVVVARVHAPSTAKLVDRWMYLEKQVAKAPQIPQSFSEALRLAADLQDRLEKAGEEDRMNAQVNKLFERFRRY